MDAEKIYHEIQRLPVMAGQIRRREASAIKFLSELYHTVYGETVTAGCSGCHIKAANKLMSLTIENLQTMNEKKFILKKGVSIEYPFRSGQRITHANLTDQKAAEYLVNHPNGAEHFEQFPKDENGHPDLSEWFPADRFDEAEEKEPKAPKEPKTPKEPKAPKEPKTE